MLTRQEKIALLKADIRLLKRKLATKQRELMWLENPYPDPVNATPLRLEDGGHRDGDPDVDPKHIREMVAGWRERFSGRLEHE